ncbi:MAG: NUDIX domain-containing protein [Bacteroidota bacterium]|nr:NUDIX domain-containing protein [Bacteroidota bacterium]
MTKKSAGILLYRLTSKILEVLLVHPGGPFWAKKDLGAWSIPKGEFSDDENPLDAALREFAEEMGEAITVSKGDFIPMTQIKQKNGKVVYAFALKHDFDVSKIKSNTFTIEWPPKSGKQQEFPEIDRGEWFDFSISKKKLNEQQAAIIDELVEKLNLNAEHLESKLKSNHK